MSYPIITWGVEIPLIKTSTVAFPAAWTYAAQGASSVVDDKYIYLVKFWADFYAGRNYNYVPFVVLKVRISDGASMLYLDANYPHVLDNNLASATNYVFLGKGLFYVSATIGGNNEPSTSYYFSVDSEFIPNSVFLVNPLFIKPNKVFACGYTSNNLLGGSLFYDPNSGAVQENFQVSANGYFGRSANIKAVTNDPTIYTGQWSQAPELLVPWGGVFNNIVGQNSNDISLSGRGETLLTYAQSYTGGYTLMVNAGKLRIENVPNNCASYNKACTMSPSNVSAIYYGWVKYPAGNLQASPPSVNIDIGMDGYNCGFGSISFVEVLFIGKGNFCFPFQIANTNSPMAAAISNAGLTVVEANRVSIWNLPDYSLTPITLDKYFPKMINNVGHPLVNWTRPVSVVGAFKA